MADQTNAEVSDERLPVDELAQEIRRVDGNHDLGAAALAEALMPFLNRRSVTSQASEGEVAEDWRADPSADDRWNAGCDFAMDQLCSFLGVDPKAVVWDAATETLDGDVSAVIGNIMRAKFGDDWAPQPSASYVGGGAEETRKLLDEAADFAERMTGQPWACELVERLAVALKAASPSKRVERLETAEPKTFDEWSEEDGDVVWWCWRDGEWLGESAYIGSPLNLGQTVEIEFRTHQGEFIHSHMVGGWPGYHTHWTQHPTRPQALQGGRS